MTEELNQEQGLDDIEELDADERAEEIKKQFKPERTKVVRNELFTDIKNAFVTIRYDSIMFNTACIKALPDVVYINLVIDEDIKMIGVRECDPDDKNAIRWCVAKDGNRKSRKLSCKDFTKPLYELMGWGKKCRYKVKGFRIDYGDEGVYIVFDLKVKKIFQERPKKGEEPVDENGNVIKTPVDRKGYFPDDIATTFGVPMEEVRKEAEQLNMTSFVSMEDFEAAAKAQEEEAAHMAAEPEKVEDPQLTEGTETISPEE